MAKSQEFDWKLVRPEYEAGIRSLKDIGRQFGCSPAGILKAAKRDGWARDLTERIRRAADAKVAAAAAPPEPKPERPAAYEREVVEVNAQLQYRIRMAHRQDIQRLRALFGSLLEEQEALTPRPAPGDPSRPLLEQLAIETEGAPDGETPDEAQRRHERARKLVVRLSNGPERIDNASKLAALLERVIKLERQAFGIDDTTPTNPPASTDWGTVSPQDAIEAYRRIVGGR
jgi:hypothetical protein